MALAGKEGQKGRVATFLVGAWPELGWGWHWMRGLGDTLGSLLPSARHRSAPASLRLQRGGSDGKMELEPKT